MSNNLEMNSIVKKILQRNPNIQDLIGLGGETGQRYAKRVNGTCTGVGGDYSPGLVKLKLPNYPINWLTKWIFGVNPDVNKKANAYLDYQYNRMIRAIRTGNAKLFFAIGLSLLKRSTAFRLALIHHGLPRGWYLRYSTKAIMRISRRVSFLVVSGETKTKLHRFYVPKANGKLRPIGAPDPEWKIIMYAHSWLLKNWLEPYWQEPQHGFRPGKGIWTAWKAILKRIHEPNIYEFDLSKFFNRVHLTDIWMSLLWAEIPRNVIDYLVQTQRHLPKLMAGYEIDPEDPELGDKPWGNFSGMWDIDPELSPHAGTFGVSQGLPTSPMLAIWWLEISWVYCMETIQYADDGIWFPEKDIEDPIDYAEKVKAYRGGLPMLRKPDAPKVEFNRDKSGWVKRLGVWEKDLKFLGTYYNASSAILYNFKKDGSRNQISTIGITDEELKKFVGKAYNPIKDWEWIISTDSVFLDLLLKNVPHWAISIKPIKSLIEKTLGNFLTIQNSSTVCLHLIMANIKKTINKRVKYRTKGRRLIRLVKGGTAQKDK